MIYRAVGLMSGSSLDGLDIAFTEFTETGGRWTFEILAADCIAYDNEWQERLKNCTTLSALDYALLHVDYGHFIGKQLNAFIYNHQLQHKVQLIASHGHTSFHLPGKLLTAQLGDGAAIAAETGLNVVSDLRALDVALGGQGAPIVPIGEKLLFAGYDCFLNIGGIANISFNANGKYIAFDVCAANRVLNMLAADIGLEYDDGGMLSASGNVNTALLNRLNALEYYNKAYPKSLPNSFGIDRVYPVIKEAAISTEDALCTCVEHICDQIKNAVVNQSGADDPAPKKMLVTGGGAFNSFLMDRLGDLLAEQNMETVIPGQNLVKYKEALIMALIGVLRWREETNALPSVTGASRESTGGALWLG